MLRAAVVNPNSSAPHFPFLLPVDSLLFHSLASPQDRPNLISDINPRIRQHQARRWILPSFVPSPSYEDRRIPASLLCLSPTRRIISRHPPTPLCIPISARKIQLRAASTSNTPYLQVRLSKGTRTQGALPGRGKGEAPCRSSRCSRIRRGRIELQREWKVVEGTLRR